MADEKKTAALKAGQSLGLGPVLGEFRSYEEAAAKDQVWQRWYGATGWRQIKFDV